jgi:hypothetical protein
VIAFVAAQRARVELSLSSIIRLASRPSLVFLVLTAVAAVTIIDGLTGRPAVAAPITTPVAFTAISVVALLALAVFLARATNIRAAIYALLVLTTTPEWFVRARTDASPTNAFVLLGVSLFGIAAFDDKATPRFVRVGLVLATAMGLVLVRFVPEGARLPIGAMAIATSIIVIVSRRDLLIGSLSGCIGVVLFILAIRSSPSFSSSLSTTATAPFTFTFTSTVVARIAYGLAPWSALLPFVILSRSRQTEEATSGTEARHAIVLALVLSIAAGTLLQAPVLPGAAGLIAMCTGLWLAELDQSGRVLPSIVGVGAICMGVILARDLDLAPDRVLDVLSAAAPLPSSGHSLATARALRVDILALAGTTFVLAVLPPSIINVPRRGLIVVAVGFIAGAILRERAYPDLIRLISPGRAFEAWSDRHQAGDEIALLGVDPKRWPSSASATFTDSERSIQWLTSAPASSRRFLAIGPLDLARANAAYRTVNPGKNLPIVAGEGAFLLGANVLIAGEKSDNPLDRIVREAAPPTSSLSDGNARSRS